MADITLEHIAETIRKPSYIAFLQQSLARDVIRNEFKEDEFFKNSDKDPVEFLVDNLTKLYKGETIGDREENDKLEEFLVFTVLQHDKQQEALEEEEKQELAENARKFQESMEKQDREDNPLYFAFKDAKDNAKDLLPNMKLDKIQSIATKKMTALTDFANKLNDPETRKQMLNDTKATLSKGMDAAKQTISGVSNQATSFMSKLPSISRSMFGKTSEPEEPKELEKPEEPLEGGKRKSKKQRKSKKGGKRKSKKGGKRKSKKNKSKKNKSKKSKK